MKYKLLLIALLPLALWAQESDSLHSQAVEHTRVRMLGVGQTELLDTYLSPEHYTGGEFRLLSSDERKSRKYENISYFITHEAHLSLSNNRADNNNEVAAMYNFQYAVHRHWQLLDGRLLLHAGPGIDANIGMLYNMRNGNNPTQLKLSLNLAPSGGASYTFTLWNKPLKVNYDLMFPILGVMFAPNFGQSYYEIFNRGNYDKNVRLTTVASTPSLRQMLSLDFKIKKCTFRVGYLGDYQQARINHLKYHSYSHMLMLGYVSHFTITKK